MVDIVAAGGVVKNSRGQTLMMFRRGVWDLPKGKAEAGETLAQTALREVSEETGIPVEALQLGKKIIRTIHHYDFNGIQVQKTTTWFAMCLLYDVPLVPQTEEDIIELRWVDNIEELNPIWESVKSVLEAEKL